MSLAKTIKSQAADTPIIFGGANCEGEMGTTLLRTFPWVDFVCSGGDIAFTEFAKAFLKDKDEKCIINGIITRKSNFFDIALTNPVMDMDSLPYPDFDDYFNDINFNHRKFNPSLVIETSRGCWWGEKFQCTFCGLNGSTMKYRSKSVHRVLDELGYLIQKYAKTIFQVIDNILDLNILIHYFLNFPMPNLKLNCFMKLNQIYR